MNANKRNNLATPIGIQAVLKEAVLALLMVLVFSGFFLILDAIL